MQGMADSGETNKDVCSTADGFVMGTPNEIIMNESFVMLVLKYY